MPLDDREVDKYLDRMAKHNSNLVQWLEDFKSKFGDHEDAKKPIADTENALLRYKQKVIHKEEKTK